MSGDIVNLRRVRKAKQKAVAADIASENRALFGKSKEERARAAKSEALERQRLDGHRLRASSDDDAGR
ncbi:MAG TPA: DUF4169 family protein [Methylovirgula sp.]